MPASELLIFVSAMGNKNAGIAFPQNPMIKIDRIFSLFSLWKFLMTIGNRQIVVIKILNEPT
jgi:hypothetical protein